MKLEVIRTKRFNKNVIEFYYPFEFNPKENLIINILGYLLVQHSKKYLKIKDINKAITENYIYDIGYSVRSYGHQAFIKFAVIIPDEKSLKEDVFAKACTILMELIYNPKVTNKKFDEEDTKIALEGLKTKCLNVKKDPLEYSWIKTQEIIDPTFHGYSMYNHPELFKQISTSSIYDFYYKNIKSKSPYIFIIGDVNKKNVQNTLSKLLDKKPYAPYNYPQNDYIKPLNKPKQITEKKSFNQSVLHMVYSVENMSEQDDILLHLTDALLSDITSQILYKILRQQEKIVYHTYSNVLPSAGIISIVARIKRENKEKAISSIYKAIESLKDTDQIKENLQAYCKLLHSDLKWDKDIIQSKLDDKINTYFGIDETEQKWYERCKEITAEDIASFTKRLKLNLIYFLEGTKDE